MSAEQPPVLPVTHIEGDEQVLHADVGPQEEREHVLSRDCWCGPAVERVGVTTEKIVAALAEDRERDEPVSGLLRQARERVEAMHVPAEMPPTTGEAYHVGWRDRPPGDAVSGRADPPVPVEPRRGADTRRDEAGAPGAAGGLASCPRRRAGGPGRAGAVVSGDPVGVAHGILSRFRQKAVDETAGERLEALRDDIAAALAQAREEGSRRDFHEALDRQDDATPPGDAAAELLHAEVWERGYSAGRREFAYEMAGFLEDNADTLGTFNSSPEKAVLLCAYLTRMRGAG